MPTPQWKEPNGVVGTWGFDKDALPPWLMIGYRSAKVMLLDFAAGLAVKSMNPAIATISEDLQEGQSRWFMINGKNPGRGFIEVRDLKRQSLAARLEVNVKRKLSLRIGFFFVQDKAGDRTTRQPD